MKKINAKLLFLALGSSLFFTSCYKKFDADSYKPKLDINGYSAANEVGASNLVGYWGFNGNINDSIGGSVGQNTGTSLGLGIKDQSLQGSLSSYVIAAPSAAVSGLSSFTIAYWVNSPAPSNGIIGQVVLANTTGFWGNIEIFFENGGTNADGKFRAHIQNGPVDHFVAKDGLINLFDKWTHIALTYNETTETFELFVNGASVYTDPVPGFGPLEFDNPGNLVFGADQFQTTPSQTSATSSQPWASYLTGRLDEVRIFNKPLDATEISSLVLLEGRGK